MQGGQAIDLDILLGEADMLPAFPGVVNEILCRIEDQFSIPEDFVEIISQDQVLVGKMLKFANSAFYGFPRTIVSLKEAIIILGMDTLKSIVLAISAYATLNSDSHGYGLAKGDLYLHSICTAMIARILAKRQRQENKEKFFVAGLLHDVGKLLLDPYASRAQKELLDCIRQGNLSLVEAEKRVFGFDHSFVGSRLAESWNLPAVLVSVIRHHHSSEKADAGHRTLVTLVQAANLISSRLRKGVGQAFLHEFDPYEEIRKLIDVGEREINEIVGEVKSHLMHLRSFL